ncbi:TPA: EscU/YscU/HrcU family type III secretion system export apparatus switch protein [Escherichia coli]|uniref:EscU/YscU/HrcU family type III secretion system export apparatus switch protein n=1 Tax=Escherichia coli TaxID=562 RepID=UPI001B02DE99|nr:EscU/YscU/HrcU family type III secretion system export apparatus switch protein [Escherichia coli]HBA3726026.1 EscU/YscU/HrcU family type III secretion system export apparatus switch protein [Escherichia coli]HBA3735229.1 EscU/YscU/HrcU family type III secretion system export apparatus switch protein [Escherichia coli]HBA3831228.1 EscU/YscU/HrcU family type III secretion system export apparatus switch protein [Escherichia coli]HBB4927043.1 EscU/YscU/HrcU family type III secretion system expo
MEYFTANKTEKPTQKKLQDASKKGQILKSRDLTVCVIMLVGTLYLGYVFDVHHIMSILEYILDHNAKPDIWDYFKAMGIGWLKTIIPFLLVCMFTTILVSWFQSKMQLATEAIKFKFDSLNPVNGLKRIFGLKTVKEFVKAILYIIFFALAIKLFWSNHKSLLFKTLDGDIISLLSDWGEMLFLLILYCLGSMIIVLIFDFIAEYFLFMKDMKMDKQEVKREYKEQEGSPEIKSKRRERHQEILSEQLKSDVSNSRLMIANPTHIAIGIYFKPHLSPIPLISVRETNEVALAVRKYAKEIGIPIITDKKLARKIYATHRRYDYVSFENIDEILRLLLWLEDVENAGQPVPDELLPSEDKFKEGEDTKSENKDNN